MTAEDISKGFRRTRRGREAAAYANELFQEAIRLGVELNNQYHTRRNRRSWDGCWKEIAPTSGCSPFYTDFGKISPLGGMCSSTPAVTSRIGRD